MVFVAFIVLMGVFVFFFFKQKTAYEMRISDWSSDVCSSDLGRVVVDVMPHLGALVSRLTVGGTPVLYLDHATLDSPTAAVRGGIPLLFPFAEIGSASCRERVCPSV